MKAMKLPRKNLIFGLSICIIIIASFFLYHFVAYMRYPKSTIIQTTSSWYANMENHTLIEVTSEGKQYEHNFKDEAKYIKTDTEVTFICEENSRNSERSYLIIHNNGNVYLKKMDSETIQIGQIKDAVRGAINQDNIAIITADEKLYFKGKLGNNRYDDFCLITGIPNVKDVVCGKEYTFVLTVDGEVYGIGLNSEEENEAFIHYETAYPVTELCGTDETIVALDKKGNVYELGFDYMGDGGRFYNDFHQLKNIRILYLLQQESIMVYCLTKEEGYIIGEMSAEVKRLACL